MQFGLCYKPGRNIAWPQLFATREQAERTLASMPELADTLHAVVV